MIMIIISFIIVLNFFLILGIVGGMEHNTIPMMTGFIICMVIIAITYILFEVIEILQRKRNISVKPIDKKDRM